MTARARSCNASQLLIPLNYAGSEESNFKVYLKICQKLSNDYYFPNYSFKNRKEFCNIIFKPLWKLEFENKSSVQ